MTRSLPHPSPQTLGSIGNRAEPSEEEPSEDAASDFPVLAYLLPRTPNPARTGPAPDRLCRVISSTPKGARNCIYAVHGSARLTVVISPLQRTNSSHFPCPCETCERSRKPRELDSQRRDVFPLPLLSLSSRRNVRSAARHHGRLPIPEPDPGADHSLSLRTTTRTRPCWASRTNAASSFLSPFC